ncbi:hypothetical protein, partial [Turicimonas muris]|uniref:hypothetical protein n=1 Tax=Turicimonas muris TaxID=1796652 RepID=UPI0023F0A08D
TPLGCSISQFFTFARKYSSQSWEPYLPFQKIRASEEDDEYVTVASKRFQETGTIRVKLEVL